jgi:hypothetical protein
VDDLLGSFHWYDALCINQADLAERSHQVGIMRQIYEKADRVVIWLGVERSGANWGLMSLANLHRQQKSVNRLWTLFPTPLSKHMTLSLSGRPWQSSSRGLGLCGHRPFKSQSLKWRKFTALEKAIEEVLGSQEPNLCPSQVLKDMQVHFCAGIGRWELLVARQGLKNKCRDK